MQILKKRILKNPLILVSLFFLMTISTLSSFAPAFTRYSYEEQNISERLEGPSKKHWLGTDSLGRDLYSRIIYGGRVSLTLGWITALIAITFGTTIGTIAGYFGGWIDDFFMRIADMLAIFPSPLMAILLLILFGRGMLGIIIAIGITAWITQARLARGQVLQIRELPYIEAAKAIGVPTLRLLTRHIFPNLLGPLLVSLSIQIPTSIMTESFLSFIGLGLQPPYSSWGTLANEGFRAMKSYPHLILFPSLILFITMLAFNYLGDGLRAYLEMRENSDGT